MYDSFTGKVQHVWVVQEDRTLSPEALRTKQHAISGLFILHKRHQQKSYDELSPMAKLLKHIMAKNNLQSLNDMDSPGVMNNSV